MPQLPFAFRKAAGAAPTERETPLERPPERDSPPELAEGTDPARAEPPEPRRGRHPDAPVSVSEVSTALRRRVESGFSRFWVEGELRSVKVHPRSGHGYFELADASASISAFMAASAVRRLAFPLKDGLHVLVEAGATVYEKRGKLQLEARRIQPMGEGALRLALEARIAALRAEGLLDPSRKRALPAHPRRVGIVTSRSGAALRDIVRTTLRRNPSAQLLLSHANVQGTGAVAALVRALKRLEPHGCDVVILARGGGSLEDLAAFNEEALARAVVACSVPVVTGVGHETDTSLVDLVADARASTPTAAAELVTPELVAVVAGLDRHRARLARALAARVVRAERDLGRLEGRLVPPLGRVHRLGQELDEFERRLREGARGRRSDRLRRLDGLERRLARLHPKARVAERAGRLAALEARLERAVEARLRSASARLEARGIRLDAAVEARRGASARTLERVEGRLEVAARTALSVAKGRFATASGRLSALSPLAVLARGYAVALDAKSGRPVRRAEDVAPGDRLDLRLAEGRLDARVEAVRPADPASGIAED